MGDTFRPSLSRNLHKVCPQSIVRSVPGQSWSFDQRVRRIGKLKSGYQIFPVINGNGTARLLLLAAAVRGRTKETKSKNRGLFLDSAALVGMGFRNSIIIISLIDQPF